MQNVSGQTIGAVRTKQLCANATEHQIVANDGWKKVHW